MCSTLGEAGLAAVSGPSYRFAVLATGVTIAAVVVAGAGARVVVVSSLALAVLLPARASLLNR